MAVLSIALLPILSLQGQFVKNVSAMERLQTRLAVERSVQQNIGALNLALKQDGRYQMEGANVTWQAKALGEGRRVRDAGGRQSRYATQLYAIHVTITYASGQQDTLMMTGMGWQPLSPYLQGL